MKNKVLYTNPVILFVWSFIIFAITFLFCIKIFGVQLQETSTVPVNVQVQKNQNPINLNEILKENTSQKIIQEMEFEEIDLEYNTEYRNNSSIPGGTIQVVQEGRDGRKNVIIIKKYIDDELISEELVSENLIKAAVNRIVEIGTGNGINQYKPKVGDTAFVTSSNLSVRLEPNKDSEKVCTLKKDDEIKIAKIEGEYLYIISKEHNGYVLADCITNINPNISYTNTEYEDKKGSSKSVLLAKLSFDMNIGKPSGFSLQQFKKVLENQPGDKNNVFKDNAEYFYYAEKQYGVNGIFLAAVGIHESGYGTSAISLNKKNLFGYGAVDSNPYGGAYSFNTYSEGIDLLARVFMKYYLNPNRYKDL